jgi:hypothetical protein
MTAPTNALQTHPESLVILQPDERYTAAFSIAVKPA